MRLPHVGEGQVVAIYEISTSEIRAFSEVTFSETGLKERADLQRLLRDKIDVIAPDTLVIAEEFGDWEESKRRIDLLAIDKAGDLVVIELKRTEDGGHMELQALRYAAMISTMTFEKVEAVYQAHLRSHGNEDGAARKLLLEFMERTEPSEGGFAENVRIVLASAEFSKELTTAVLWLNDQGLDICCVRLKPYADGARVLLDVQQVIPLPEAEDYQIKLREKALTERIQKQRAWDRTAFIAEVQRLVGQSGSEVATALLDWVTTMADVEVSWGMGSETANCTPTLMLGSLEYPIFRMRSKGQVIILLESLRNKLPTAGGAIVSRLIDALKPIPGVTYAGDDDKRLRLQLDDLRDEAVFQCFKNAVVELAAAIRAAHASPP